MTVTLVALYDHYGDAEVVVHDLEKAGISENDISIVASNLGDRYATRIKDGSEAGAGAAAGAVLGGAGGGLIGSLISSGVSKENAQIYAEGVRRGGTIVTVRVAEDKVAQLRSILQSRSWVEPIARGRAYRDAGWSGFDENAPPYIPE